VPPRGEIKFLVGMTAPLEIGADGSRSFALPAIADRNFDVSGELRHAVWIEGDEPIGWRRRGVAGSGSAVATLLRDSVADADLLKRRPRIWATPILAPSTRLSTVAAKRAGDGAQPGLAIVQTIAPAPAKRTASLVILLDGSAGNRGAAEGLRKALGAIPTGLPASLLVASAEPLRIASAPWSAAQRARFEQAIDDTDFEGGQDNLPMLAEAVGAAPDPGSALLWIHGPQPVKFARSTGLIEQMLERSASLPRLIRYQAQGGPQFTMAGNAWFETARDAVPSGDSAADLSSLAAELGRGDAWTVARMEGAHAPGAAASSVHIARLWGAGRLAAAAGTRGAERQEAIALAHRLNIVTPVSGAVVLEQDDEYGASGLKVPDPADVPTVPEPGTWALIAIVAGLLLWMLRRRRLWSFA
jgi:hypothetical protein